MKVVIYAMGRIFERYKEKIDWSQVVALSDKNRRYDKTIHGCPVVSPEALCKLEYDFLAVFSNTLFEEIKMELSGEYFVPQDKIIPWSEIVFGQHRAVLEIIRYYKIFCQERKCKKVLDYGMSVISENCLIKDEFISGEKVILDGVYGNRAIHNESLYDHIYKKYAECSDYYDAILLWDEPQYIKVPIEQMSKRTRYILLHTAYLVKETSIKKNVKEKLERYGKVICISGQKGLFWVIDTKSIPLQDDIEIYIATHKNYNLHSDSLYKPLCVGNYQKDGYLTELSGENIAHVNPQINECTALYWIWKNTESKYVGLSHYRRYFYNNEIKSMDNFLDMEHACRILQEYDIILPRTYPSRQMTVFEQIYTSMDQELCMKGYSLFRKKLEEKQSDYIQAFDSVMEGRNTFLCNMFVTRREILNEYCQWLFSFLIETAEELNVEAYDSYSQRVIGFFAERMWTVWLRKNKLRIKELPYVTAK
jgi:hypothetical protein